jgi:hypothetical protein
MTELQTELTIVPANERSPVRSPAAERIWVAVL